MRSVDRLTVPREQVSAADLSELKVDIDRDFPGSTLDDFRRYPVLSEGGWYLVIKHQPTLRSLVRTPWKPLGPVSLTSEGLEV